MAAEQPPHVGLALVLESIVKQRLRHPKADSMDVMGVGCASHAQRKKFGDLSSVMQKQLTKYHMLRTKQKEVHSFFNKQHRKYKERKERTRYTAGILLNGTQSRTLRINGTESMLQSETKVEPVPVGARLLSKKMAQWIEEMVADPKHCLHRFADGGYGSCEAAVGELTREELHAIADGLEERLEALEASPELTRVKRREWVDTLAESNTHHHK